MIVNEQNKFLTDVCLLVKFANNAGFLMSSGEFWRTQEQQEIYLKNGKSKAKYSRHQDRMAADLNFFNKEGKMINDKETLEMFGSYWEGLDDKNRWGGRFIDFYDANHFERSK